MGLLFFAISEKGVLAVQTSVLTSSFVGKSQDLEFKNSGLHSWQL